MRERQLRGDCGERLDVKCVKFPWSLTQWPRGLRPRSDGPGPGGPSGEPSRLRLRLRLSSIILATFQILGLHWLWLFPLPFSVEDACDELASVGLERDGPKASFFYFGAPAVVVSRAIVAGGIPSLSRNARPKSCARGFRGRQLCCITISPIGPTLPVGGGCAAGPRRANEPTAPWRTAPRPSASAAAAAPPVAAAAASPCLPGHRHS